MEEFEGRRQEPEVSDIVEEAQYSNPQRHGVVERRDHPTAS